MSMRANLLRRYVAQKKNAATVHLYPTRLVALYDKLILSSPLLVVGLASTQWTGIVICMRL